MADSAEKPGSFKVTDRRAFVAGDPRGEDVPGVKDQPAAVAPAPAEPAKPAPPAPTTEPPRSLPPADFATLVLSLGSSALMCLGEDGGEGKKVERNLPMAKHAIDLLTVLEDKTKGNLSAEEEHILESLLFDLRLRYVEALKTSSPGA
jgi:hypothetical protein